jgi:hypothetical protein
MIRDNRKFYYEPNGYYTSKENRMKKTVFDMSEYERQKTAMMLGDMILMMQEGCRTEHIAVKYNLYDHQVRENILEILYTIRKHVGWRTYFKELFTK